MWKYVPFWGNPTPIFQNTSYLWQKSEPERASDKKWEHLWCGVYPQGVLILWGQDGRSPLVNNNGRGHQDDIQKIFVFQIRF